MKQLKQLLILSLSFLLFTSAINIIGTKLSQNYISSKHKYQISYPKGWKVDESKAENILLTGPIIDTVTKQTDGSILISAKSNNKPVSTVETYKASIQNLQSNSTDLKIIEEGEMVLGEVKSKYLIYLLKTGTTTLSSLRFYFSNGKTGFILEGTVQGETLGKYKDIYFDIAKTIKFSKK